ncbi:hypothetical protein Tco_0861939, partial [Tanacetum coccineum]
MDDPNITMEEYIRLKEEKSCRRGKVFNWETAKYGKIWDNEDVHDLRYVETEFPSIVFNDTLTSDAALSCEPTVSSLNDGEIDFRISFDESDDEDCTVIFDKNSFSYKIISVNDLKTDSENDNDKVNMSLLPSPDPMVSCLNDLDLFKDFENEFLAIVYNDALTSKSDFSTEPVVIPQHIDEFDLKEETSLSEYKDNDDEKIDIKESSRGNVINTDDGAYAHGSNKLLKARMQDCDGHTCYSVVRPCMRDSSALLEVAELQAKDMTIKTLKSYIKRVNETSTSESVKKDFDEIETINIELDHRVTKLIAENEHLKQTYKQLYDSIKPSRVRAKEQTESLVNQVNQKNLKGKDIVNNTTQVSNATTIALGMYKLDPVILAPKAKNNREAHEYYLKHTMKQAGILKE